jgi:hypothetical protein
MSEPAPPTRREQSRATVGRLTKLLAGAAVAATALFGVAVASGGRHATGSTVDDSGTTAVDDSSYGSYDDDDSGFDLGPSQGVWSSSQTPAATSGGS